jgi:hypothetical protein
MVADPVKCPAADSRTVIAHACARHGAANTGPPASRGKSGDAMKHSAASFASGRLKVFLPHINVQ